MSKVDLSKAKAGDTVHFRCGGNWNIQYIKNIHGRFHIWFVDSHDYIYLVDGSAKDMNNDCLFDIIRIESK